MVLTNCDLWPQSVGVGVCGVVYLFVWQYCVAAVLPCTAQPVEYRAVLGCVQSATQDCAEHPVGVDYFMGGTPADPVYTKINKETTETDEF